MKITKEDLDFIKVLKKNPGSARFSKDTTFSSDVYLYNKDEVSRQKEAKPSEPNSTYEDHIRVITTAHVELKQETQLEIARTILTHRYFKQYRIDTFKGKGSYMEDLQFLLRRIANVIDTKMVQIVKPVDIDLSKYPPGTLLQVNHLVNTVEIVSAPPSLPVEQWAAKYNKGSSETTTYIVKH